MNRLKLLTLEQVLIRFSGYCIPSQPYQGFMLKSTLATLPPKSATTSGWDIYSFSILFLFISSHYFCSTKKPLFSVLQDPVMSKDSMQSKRYHLVAGDLRNMSVVGEKLLECGIDTGYTYRDPLR